MYELPCMFGFFSIYLIVLSYHLDVFSSYIKHAEHYDTQKTDD